MVDFYENKNNIKPINLIKKKLAYIKLHKINGESEIKEWNAYRFTNSADVVGNLKSGYLRNWKDNGIFKAELSINRNDFN